MKKVFKDYLEIYVGSRGCLEGVEVKSFEDIERELKEKSDENCKWIEEDDEMDEDCKDELLGLRIVLGLAMGFGVWVRVRDRDRDWLVCRLE